MEITKEILGLVQILWDYLKLDEPLEKADLIIAMGNHDTRTAEYAADLFNQGCADQILFVGGFGKVTKDLWNVPEALKFKEIAMAKGVPEEKIILETESTDTIRNMTFGKALLKKNNIKHDKVIWVGKPYMGKRTAATLKVFWKEPRFILVCRKDSLEEYLNWYDENPFVSKDDVLQIIVGDLQRLKIYVDHDSSLGEPIPENVMDAYNKLLSLGFNKRLEPDEEYYWNGFVALKNSI